MKRTLITVPMKEPSRSKTRLANALSEDEREILVRFLYRRTLAFLGPIAARTGAVLSVVTSSETAASIARDAGYWVIPEPEGCDLSQAVTEAAIWARQRVFAALCVLPADLVAPKETDVLRLLSSEADVTICPSLDRGTNALLVSPPGAMRFRFGPQSALRHLEEAEDKGLRGVIMPMESLRFDLDTSACLRRAILQQPDFRAVCG
jgi:2-phospho-L-lactate guanylyltransferase